MIDKFKLNQISVREWAVALPLFGAVLAITYDVGFFYGIGISYFTSFSLAEHILFAFQMIPVAFGIAIMIPTGVLSYWIGYRRAQAASPPLPEGPTDIDKLHSIREEIQARYRKDQRTLLGLSFFFFAIGIAAAVFLKTYFLARAL